MPNLAAHFSSRIQKATEKVNFLKKSKSLSLHSLCRESPLRIDRIPPI